MVAEDVESAVRGAMKRKEKSRRVVQEQKRQRTSLPLLLGQVILL